MVWLKKCKILSFFYQFSIELMPNYRRVFADAHSYFLTLVTHQRNPILIENIELLRQSFKVSREKYTYEIQAIVILPDHFHMIILPENAEDYPNIISQIKQHFSRHCDPIFYSHLSQSQSREKAGYKPIWQKKYFEHTIRTDEDYQKRFDYIHYNPVRHGYVLKTEDWQYSSFHKHVKLGVYESKWGDFDLHDDFE